MKRLSLVLLVVFLLAPFPSHADPPSASMAQLSGLLVIDAPSGATQSTTSIAWADVPNMNGGFTLAGISDVAVTFCAESFVSAGKRMVVRALVDGLPASPSDVIFANNSMTPYSRCFTFVKNALGAGYHTLSIQWMVDSGGTAYIGDRTTHVTWAQPDADELTLLAVAAPSGPDKVITGGAGWTDVPDISGTLSLPAVSDVAITFSAEAETSNRKRMFIRALVDGVVASPSDEILVVGGFLGVRSFTFVKKNLGVGAHTIKIQALVDSGGDGYLGDRTLKTVGARVLLPRHVGHLFTAAPSGPQVTTTSGAWVDVPDLSGSLYVPAMGDCAITFTAEIYASGAGRIFARALLDGNPISPSDVVHTTGGWNGTHAFSFVMHNVPPGNHTVKIQWLVDAGNTAYAGDRTLTAYTFAKLALHPPKAVDVEPLCGKSPTGQKVTFTTTFYDADGSLDIKLFYLIFNTNPSYTNGVALAYNHQVDKMLIRNDSNTAWIVGGSPGSGSDLNTARATLHVSDCMVTWYGNYVDVQWVVTFKAPFAGRVCNIFSRALDYAGLNSGWQGVGSLGVGTPSSPPCVGYGDANRSAEVNQLVTFLVEADDPDGWQNLKLVYALFAPTPNTTGDVVYVAYNQDLNKISLRNDAGTAWLGGYAPGSGTTIQNSRVTVDVSQSSLDTSLGYIRLTLALRFKTAFAGYKNFYISASDDAGYGATWHRQGAVEVVVP